ncbi:unnamed protein product, partial [Owenia fusiformis]
RSDNEATNKTYYKHRLKACPLCGAKTTGVPRHYRQVHKKVFRKSELTQEQIIKLYSRKSTDKKTDARPYKMCPVIWCDKMRQRIDQHLLRDHGLLHDSKDYQDYLSG